MNSPNILVRQGHRLLQIGVALLLFTSFEEFAIPYFASPIVGRSVHTLSALFGLILVAFGLLWPRLRLGAAHSRIAFWFLVYSGLAVTAVFFLAATWGAGQSVMPLSGAPLGTAVQEAAITAVSYSSAPTGIIAFALILWGLRTPSNRAALNAR
jgi:hydroxylaminobenzene mutase